MQNHGVYEKAIFIVKADLNDYAILKYASMRVESSMAIITHYTGKIKPDNKVTVIIPVDNIHSFSGYGNTKELWKFAEETV